jgi:hypothetical protein
MKKLLNKLLILLRLKKAPPVQVQGGGGPGEEGS